MGSLWRIFRRFYGVEIVVLLAFAGLGLAMDRWFVWITPQMRNWTASTSAVYFPLLAWQITILALVAFIAWRERSTRVVLGIGACAIGSVFILLAFLGASSVGNYMDSWLGRSCPQIARWYILSWNARHHMIFTMAEELLWIGLAGLGIGSVLHRSRLKGSVTGPLVFLTASIAVFLCYHLLIDPFFLRQLRFVARGQLNPSELAIFFVVIRRLLASSSSFAALVLVLLASRKSRWIALPWLIAGLALSLLSLVPWFGGMGLDSLRDLKANLMLTYEPIGFPALAARILAIGGLGLLLRGNRKNTPRQLPIDGED